VEYENSTLAIIAQLNLIRWGSFLETSVIGRLNGFMCSSSSLEIDTELVNALIDPKEQSFEERKLNMFCNLCWSAE